MAAAATAESGSPKSSRETVAKRAALDASSGIDLLYRHFRRALHRGSDRVTERPGEPDTDGAGVIAAGGGKNQESDE